MMTIQRKVIALQNALLRDMSPVIFTEPGAPLTNEPVDCGILVPEGSRRFDKPDLSIPYSGVQTEEACNKDDNDHDADDVENVHWVLRLRYARFQNERALSMRTLEPDGTFHHALKPSASGSPWHRSTVARRSSLAAATAAKDGQFYTDSHWVPLLTGIADEARQRTTANALPSSIPLEIERLRRPSGDDRSWNLDLLETIAA